MSFLLTNVFEHTSIYVCRFFSFLADTSKKQAQLRTKKSAKVNQFKKLAEIYCKGESFGVQDLLNATETMQFPWSGRCCGRL